ncbi:MAG: CRTAC1 family protein [Candidatus Limnocylindrales bacterium]
MRVVVFGVLCATAVIVGAGLVASGAFAPRGATPHAAGPPRFVQEAASARLEHAYEGEFEYFVGGGAAIFDCNSDALPDLYFAGGSAPAGLFINMSEPGGELRFDRRADPSTDLDAVRGAYPLDVDSDAMPDLVVLRYGEDVLLRGLGACRFERANEAWSFNAGPSWSTAFSARWDAGRSWPTLAFGNYLASTDPNEFHCSANELFRPAPSGAVYDPAVALAPGWCALSMLFSDWERAGCRDLRISNDRHYYGDASGGEEQLWNIPSEGAPSLYTRQDGWKPVRIWGMGIASYDVTGDGYPDYYLTSQADNKLQSLADGAGKPDFKDIALGRGATAHRPFEGDTTMPSTAWHDEFADVNNDGFIDLFVAKGNVEAMPEHATRDPSNLLLGQADGTFEEAAQAAGIVDFGRARGGGLADFNADGLLDLVVVVRRENVLLWRNVGSGTPEAPAAMGNWISLAVSQQTGNREAIGAWLEVRVEGRTQLRERTVGGGHVSGQLVPIHFGLGAASVADVRITWPDGEVGPWQAVAANQRVLIERETSLPQVVP